MSILLMRFSTLSHKLNDLTKQVPLLARYRHSQALENSVNFITVSAQVVQSYIYRINNNVVGSD